MLDSCNFSFHVSGIAFDGDTLSKKLNLVPTYLQTAGTAVISGDGAMIRIRERTHWCYRNIGKPGFDQTSALRRFLLQLRESQHVPKELTDAGAKLRIYFVVLSSSPSAGESFDLETIELLASLRIALDVEMFKERSGISHSECFVEGTEEAKERQVDSGMVETPGFCAESSKSDGSNRP